MTNLFIRYIFTKTADSIKTIATTDTPIDKYSNKFSILNSLNTNKQYNNSTPTAFGGFPI